MSVEESANSFAVVVKNTKMNSYCVWSPETFEAKLPVIKDIYEVKSE